MSRLPKSLRFVLLIFLTLALVLSACSKGTGTPTLPAETPVPEATSTPTTPPARLLLFDPASQAGDLITGLLTTYATTNSLVFETVSTLDQSFTGVKIIVLFSPPPELLTIAAANLETQFIVIGSDTLQLSANISQLKTNKADLFFMAGYLSAVTAADWRSSGMVADDAGSPAGAAVAFENGVRYICNQCTPVYPPMLYYPTVADMSGQSDVNAWISEANRLLEGNVNTVYLSPEGDFPDVLTIFQTAKTTIYGSNPATPNAALYGAIINYDYSTGLTDMLTAAVSGQGGKVVRVPVSIVVNNIPDKLTPARQALFDKTAQALSNDTINPLSIP